MSRSLNEITTGIAANFGKEQDEPFKKMLAMKVDFWRSKLIVNSLEKHPEQKIFYRQTLYIPMGEESLLPDCITGPDMCKVAQSVSAIPGPMRLGGTLFDYIGSVDGSNPFKLLQPGTIRYLKAGRYSKNIIYYEWRSLTQGDNRVIIYERSKLPLIRIDAVFDDPTKVMEFNCNSNGDCDYWDSPYPATGDMLQTITQYILEVDFGQNRKELPENKEVELNPNDPKNSNDGKTGR